MIFIKFKKYFIYSNYIYKMSSYITHKKSPLDFSLTHIYYNVNICNANNKGDKPNLPCRYQESRDVAIVTNPSEWACSVIRFACSTSLIPIMIMPIQVNQPDINLSTLSVIIQDTASGQISESFLKYTPTNNQQVLPKPPIPNQDVTNDYYYIYHYQDLIDMLNTAFQNAFNALTAPPAGAVAPYMFRDNTGYFNLVADKNYVGEKTPSPSDGTLRIYFNENLYKYFGNFQNYYYNQRIIGFSNIRNHWIYIKDNKNGNFDSTTGLYTMRQEFPSSNNWSVFQKLVLISNIPIIPEATPQSQPFNSNGNIQDSGIANQKLILTDFQAHGADTYGWESQSQIVYLPSSQYRYIDMCSNQPLKSLDLAVFWSDNYENLYPLYLAPNSNFNCKILFRKKSDKIENIIV